MHLGGYQGIELENEDLEEVEHVEVEDDQYLSHVSSGHKGAGHSHEVLIFVDFREALLRLRLALAVSTLINLRCNDSRQRR